MMREFPLQGGAWVGRFEGYFNCSGR